MPSRQAMTVVLASGTLARQSPLAAVRWIETIVMAIGIVALECARNAVPVQEGEVTAAQEDEVTAVAAQEGEVTVVVAHGVTTGAGAQIGMDDAALAAEREAGQTSEVVLTAGPLVDWEIVLNAAVDVRQAQTSTSTVVDFPAGRTAAARQKLQSEPLVTVVNMTRPRPRKRPDGGPRTVPRPAIVTVIER